MWCYSPNFDAKNTESIELNISNSELSRFITEILIAVRNCEVNEVSHEQANQLLELCRRRIKHEEKSAFFESL